jgi:phospholipid transport system substrate-binding protein
MRPRHIAIPLALGLALSLGAPPLAAASADDPQAFVEKGHQRIAELLRQPESTARAGELDRALTSFVDYDELTRRAFGDPCPPAEPSCENLWGGYSDAQRTEVRGLLEKLIRKNYEKNLKKTLDYEVTYRGQRDAGGDTKVLTEAKNKLKPREPSVRVDYVVKPTEHGLKVVDIVTEGSSMTKVYYDQFRKKMHEPSEGYPNIVQKLNEKIAAP